MLTADTITDEQIRELQRSIAGHVFPASGMAHTGLSEIWHVTQLALGECADPVIHGGLLMNAQRHSARAHIANYINARTAQKEG